MPPINPYDLALIKKQQGITAKILQQYLSAVQSIIPTLNNIQLKGKAFRLVDYPALQKKVDGMLAKLNNQVYAITVNGIKDSWDLSNKKNNVLVDKRLAGKRLKKNVRQELYDPNKGALDAFINRKEKGIDLSDRIWKAVQPFKNEMEQALGIGIGTGQSSQKIAKQVKQYLKEPDKLFRRVRGEDGKLYLSAAARNYNPGQGVYRSSFKNAMRVARTETNGAYRSADYERWQKLPFVIGIRIQLSNAHPKYDICDKLVGIYPKDFKFQGWHPQCICFATAEQISDEEYDKMEADILNGRPVTVPSSGIVQQPPANFNKYLGDNKAMLQRLKNQPYWMRDNPGYIDMPVKVKNEIKSSSQVIGTQLTNISKSIRSQVSHTLEMIDKVHGDGVLDNIPFKGSSAKSFSGQFKYFKTGKAKEITLSVSSQAAEVTIAHEIGHYLDLYSIGDKGYMGSIAAGSPSNKVVKKALESQALKKIKKILDSGLIMGKDKMERLSYRTREHLKYLMNPEEIWARAYAQYIAEKSGSEKMKKGILGIIEKDKGNKDYLHQWESEDFKDILDAIDEMMRDLGWRINQ